MLNNDDYLEFLDFGYQKSIRGIDLILGFTNLTNNLISFYYKDGELSKVTGKMRMGDAKILEVLRKKIYFCVELVMGVLEF